jgi:hypothetical protein
MLSVLSAGYTHGQVGRISFSSAGGSNPSVPTSVGEPIISNNANFGVGSRKSAATITSISPVAKTQSIFIFPNPTSSQVTIDFAGKEKEQMLVNVFDMNGKVLFRRKFIEYPYTISLLSLQNGAYIISVVDSKGKELINQTIVKH